MYNDCKRKDKPNDHEIHRLHGDEYPSILEINDPNLKEKYPNIYIDGNNPQNQK